MTVSFLLSDDFVEDFVGQGFCPYLNADRLWMVMRISLGAITNLYRNVFAIAASACYTIVMLHNAQNPVGVWKVPMYKMRYTLCRTEEKVGVSWILINFGILSP